MKKTLFVFISLFCMMGSLSSQVVSSLLGAGTVADPFQIGTVADLKFLREAVAKNYPVYDNPGIYFKLTNNIDLSGETTSWTPIGPSANINFMGNFDGNGKKITGLKIGSPSTPSTIGVNGLFGVCMVGFIKNLVIESAYVNVLVGGPSDVSIGILAANVTNCKVSDCKIDGVIQVNHSGTGTVQVGGLSGKLENYGELLNSSTNATIKVNSSFTGVNNSKFLNVGGLVGAVLMNTTKIRNCFSSSSVEGIATANAQVNAGGLAGTSLGLVANSYASGSVTATTNSGNAKAAGLVGWLQSGSTLTNCIALNPSATAISTLGVRVVNRIAEIEGNSVLAQNYAQESMLMNSGTSSSSLNSVGFAVSFDTQGGSTAPITQNVKFGTKISTVVDPTKSDSLFGGWYTSKGLRFEPTTLVTENLNLHAKWWKGPKQYIALSSLDLRYFSSLIKNSFGSCIGKDVAIATQPLIRVFERDMNTVLVPAMKKHLADAVTYDVPIMIFLSVLPMNKVRPDLYNWWDATAAGYNPNNVNNVEWTGWDASTAVKIGWLNWGTQMRVAPMPNIMSPDFMAAETEAIVTLMKLVKEWYDILPANKKYLLAGIRTTDEMAMGVNDFYITNGNSLVNLPEANDPQVKLDPYNLPSRGLVTIGYNAVKTAKIRTSGTLTIEDLNEVCRRHGEFLSKIYCDSLKFPREKLFTSSFAKTAGEAQTCVNNYSCPSWSFYNGEAKDPTLFTSAMGVIKTSTAPGWCMAEWGIDPAESDPIVWKNALKASLNLSGNKLIRITGNRVISHEGVVYQPAATGIQSLLNDSVYSSQNMGESLGSNSTLSLLNNYISSSSNVPPVGFTWSVWKGITTQNNGNPVFDNGKYTALSSISFTNIKVTSSNGGIILMNYPMGETIQVYNSVGALILTEKCNSEYVELKLKQGVYFIKGIAKPIAVY
jgi:hypothetical protein